MAFPEEIMARTTDREIPIAEQITCVEREIAMRVKLMPRWIRQHKILPAAAELEIERMRAVLNTLRAAYIDWARATRRVGSDG